MWSSDTIFLTIILFGVECTEMVEFNALTSGYMTLCLNQIKKLICHLHTQYFLPKILFVVECREMVEFNAVTLRHMDLFVNQLKKFICDLHAHYPWSIILLGVECTKVVAFNALTSGHMNSYLNQLNNTFAIFIYNIPYQWHCWALNDENGSIQRSNIRTYELVIKSAIKTLLLIFRHNIPYQ